MKKGKKEPLSAWGKIVRAAQRGTGLRLTAEEVRYLSLDDAINTVGEDDLLCWNANGYNEGSEHAR